jgi:hypothetical protein
MIKVTYRDHTVELVSTLDPGTGKWNPRATAIFVGISGDIVRPLRSPGVYDTEAEANEVALTRAKAWIDQSKQ